MKNIIEFIKTTAIGGLMLILPVAVIIFILGYVINLLVSLNNKLAQFLPYEIFDNALVIMAIAIIIMIICISGTWLSLKSKKQRKLYLALITSSVLALISLA